MQLQDKNIILTGFMGTGKTTVGKYLASMLNYDFIDTDKEIERTEKQSISNIFKNFGEEYFRQKEQNICLAISKKQHCIISTGGGTLLNPINFQVLEKTGYIICLKASWDCIVQRLYSEEQQKRPLFLSNGKQLYTLRSSFYDSFHLQLDTTNKSISQIAQEILSCTIYE